MFAGNADNEREIVEEAGELRQLIGLDSGYTPEAVAQALGVNVSTVYRWLQSGQLGGKQIGKQWRTTVEEVREFIERQDLAKKVLRDAREELRRVRKLRPEKKWRIERCEMCKIPIVTDGIEDAFGNSVVEYSSEGVALFSCRECRNDLLDMLRGEARHADEIPLE